MARLFVCILGIVALLGVPHAASGDVVGQQEVFMVDHAMDAAQRTQLSATLQKVTDRLSFYVEDAWWSGLSSQERTEALRSLEAAATRFEKTTYPTLVNVFGSEARPGVDGDPRITVLLHVMREDAGGYFRNLDGYSKLQFPTSNEREMVYLNTTSISSPFLDSLLAHEFFHLIYFNQKELKQGIQDDAWLQEGLAELAPTILDYTIPFQGSYLEKRRQDFLRESRDSLTEWRNRPADYGVAAMFFHYLLEKYGQQVIVDIVRSGKAGIGAVEDALAKNNTGKDFAQVFEDWTVAAFLNDCSFGEQYCYKREGLRNLRVVPFTNFLPVIGDGSLRVTNLTKAWAGNWNKIGGGRGTLEFQFNGSAAVDFTVPYAVEKRDGFFDLGFLDLDGAQAGSVTVERFGTENTAFIMLPSIPRFQSSFGDSESSHFFTWTARVTGFAPAEEPGGNGLTESQIQAILTLLRAFGAEESIVANVEAALRGAPAPGAPPSAGAGIPAGFRFTTELQQGVAGQEVRYLQMVLNADPASRLASLGPGSPGQETENFGPLTLQAVIRFQEKYAADVLAPWGLTSGTGLVGSTTRAKLNQLL